MPLHKHDPEPIDLKKEQEEKNILDANKIAEIEAALAKKLRDEKKKQAAKQRQLEKQKKMLLEA